MWSGEKSGKGGFEGVFEGCLSGGILHNRSMGEGMQLAMELLERKDGERGRTCQ